MTFIIGNPTNIYVATSYGIGFIEYLKVMFLPTLASAIVSFVVLYLLFRKELKKPAQTIEQTATIKNKLLLVIGLIHLGVCTIILAIGSYVNIEMWLVSLISAISLILWVTAICLIKKRPPKEITRTLIRAPWQLVPFVLSMFTLILGLQSSGVTDLISKFLGGENAVFKYGTLSFLSSNIINNIPMSVFFCPIITPLNGLALKQAVYATIIGSNLGAILTPIGALAGIMWTALLKSYNVKYSYLDFIKYGLAVSIPSLTACLGVLALVL
jgi:arsenical pump membrane protein